MENQSNNNEPNRSDDFIRFYKSYFMDYWEIKFKLLKHEIDKFDIQKQKLAEINGYDTIPNLEKKYLLMLKLDLHFMKFQIIESLFSLIFALENRDDEYIWYNLSFPRYQSDIRNYPYDRINILSYYGRMKNYLKNGGADLIPFWKYLFFYNVDTSQYDKNFKIISENIGDLLTQLSLQLKDRDDYNAYKHSLRCLPFSNYRFSISYDNFKTLIPGGFAKNGLDILSYNEKNGDIWINVFSKSYSIKEDSYYIEICLELMKNIINTRRSHFFHEEVEQIYFFEEIEKEFHNEYSLISQSRSITSINTIYSRGCEALQQENFKMAEFYFEKVLQVNKDHYNSMFHLGYCHYRLEEYQTAIKYCENYEKNGQAEYYAENLYNLALSYYRNNDFESADKFFGKFLGRCEEQENPELDEDQKFVDAKYLRVDSKLKLNKEYFEKHKKNNTNQHINPAEKILDSIDDKDFRYPEIWDSMAFIEFKLRRYDKSKEKYKKLATHYPDNFDNINRLAFIYYMEGVFEKSEELLSKSLQINKEYFYTWNTLAILRKKQGLNDEYYKACENSLIYSRNDEQKKIAFNNLGDYYSTIGDYERALKFFQKSLDIDNSFENAISGLINSLWKLKKFNRIINFTENLEFNQNNSLNLKVRAYSFSEIGEHDKALNIVDELIPINNINNKILTDLYDTKGDIYKNNGNLEKSIEFYQKALDNCESEYEFIVETKRKLTERRSQLNKQ